MPLQSEVHSVYRGKHSIQGVHGDEKAVRQNFYDGLGGMAHGLFATLIIGTIIQQAGTFMGGETGNLIFLSAKWPQR